MHKSVPPLEVNCLLTSQLAAKKHNFLLVARNEQKLKQQRKELSNKRGIEVYYIVTDLSKPNSVEYVFEESKSVMQSSP
jgi:short-subunit dehydrogenase